MNPHVLTLITHLTLFLFYSIFQNQMTFQLNPWFMMTCLVDCSIEYWGTPFCSHGFIEFQLIVDYNIGDPTLLFPPLTLQCSIQLIVEYT